MSDLEKLLYGDRNEEQLSNFRSLEKDVFDKYEDFFKEHNLDPRFCTAYSHDGNGITYAITNELVKQKMGKELQEAFDKVFKKP